MKETVELKNSRKAQKRAKKSQRRLRILERESGGLALTETNQRHLGVGLEDKEYNENFVNQSKEENQSFWTKMEEEQVPKETGLVSQSLLRRIEAVKDIFTPSIYTFQKF